jgi:hypothetical protein
MASSFQVLQKKLKLMGIEHDVLWAPACNFIDCGTNMSKIYPCYLKNY